MKTAARLETDFEKVRDLIKFGRSLDDRLNIQIQQATLSYKPIYAINVYDNQTRITSTPKVWDSPQQELTPTDKQIRNAQRPYTEKTEK